MSHGRKSTPTYLRLRAQRHEVQEQEWERLTPYQQETRLKAALVVIALGLVVVVAWVVYVALTHRPPTYAPPAHDPTLGTRWSPSVQSFANH